MSYPKYAIFIWHMHFAQLLKLIFYKSCKYIFFAKSFKKPQKIAFWSLFFTLFVIRTIICKLYDCDFCLSFTIKTHFAPAREFKFTNKSQSLSNRSFLAVFVIFHKLKSLALCQITVQCKNYIYNSVPVIKSAKK